MPDVLLQPHNASLEMTFYEGKQFPAEYRGDIFAAEHGSWNKSIRAGYEVIRVPLHQSGHASGEYEDFLTGFVRRRRARLGPARWCHRRPGWFPAVHRRWLQFHLAGELWRQIMDRVSRRLFLPALGLAGAAVAATGGKRTVRIVEFDARGSERESRQWTNRKDGRGVAQAARSGAI